jgi:hypothetical protein
MPPLPPRRLFQRHGHLARDGRLQFRPRPGEADGSEQKAFFARGGISPTEYFRIDAMARYHVNNTDVDVFNSVFDPVGNTTFDDGILDDASGLTNEREQSLGRISAELDLFEKRWSHKLFADRLQDDFFSRDHGALTFSNLGERRRVGYLTTARLVSDLGLPATHTLVGLIEKVDESFENVGAFSSADEERSTRAVAGEYRGAFARRSS